MGRVGAARLRVLVSIPQESLSDLLLSADLAKEVKCKAEAAV